MGWRFQVWTREVELYVSFGKLFFFPMGFVLKKIKYEPFPENCKRFENTKGGREKKKSWNCYHYKRKRKRKGKFDIQKSSPWRNASYLTVCGFKKIKKDSESFINLFSLLTYYLKNDFFAFLSSREKNTCFPHCLTNISFTYL